jgi:hypothetical protein
VACSRSLAQGHVENADIASDCHADSRLSNPYGLRLGCPCHEEVQIALVPGHSAGPRPNYSTHDGIIAVANAHKDNVKLTFSHGAGLPDPDKLFNAGLEGNAWRAIDFFEGDKINERALKNLVRTAVDYNQIKLKRKAPAGTPYLRSTPY